MPMKPGSSQQTVSQNIREFHGGPTYEHTKAKFGKATADKQAVAAALHSAGKGKEDRPKAKAHNIFGRSRPAPSDNDGDEQTQQQPQNARAIFGKRR